MDKIEKLNFTQKELYASSLLVTLKKHGRKKFIEDCIRAYRAYFNEEYINHLKEIAKLRKKQANKYASTPDGEMRLATFIPNRLYNMIDNFLEPRFLATKDEIYWFAHEFPEFMVPEKL